MIRERCRRWKEGMAFEDKGDEYHSSGETRSLSQRLNCETVEDGTVCAFILCWVDGLVSTDGACWPVLEIPEVISLLLDLMHL